MGSARRDEGERMRGKRRGKRREKKRKKEFI